MIKPFGGITTGRKHAEGNKRSPPKTDHWFPLYSRERTEQKAFRNGSHQREHESSK